MDVRDLSLTAIFASVYASLVALQVQLLPPLAYGPIQLRVADCLIPLAALFGWPLALGVSVGCLIGNAYYWLGPVDVILGPIANFTAATAVFLLRRHRLVACVAGALPIGLIVGGYLWLFFPPPDFPGPSLPLWAAMMLSITVSSLITVTVIGYALLSILSRPGILGSLRSHGLKVAT